MVKCFLKFTDFPKFCQELVSNLHGATELSDISLVGDDNKPIRAHKIVISAHSEVIREALASTEHEKPLLHCRGFSSQDIQLLLDFMYLGQTSCEAKNVNLFFKTGKFLQIKQLEDECDDDAENLKKEFSLDVLDQFCDIIFGDKEVKDEEVNQIETDEFDDNTNAELCEEQDMPQGNEEKESSEELKSLDLENFYVEITEREKETKKTFIKDKNKPSTAKRKAITTVKRLYNSAMQSYNESFPLKEWKAIDETEIEDLNANLSKFFKCLKHSEGGSYNINTLNTYFYALRGYLKDTKSVDIRHDKRFRPLHEIFQQRLRESEKFGSSASNAFREEDIQTAFKTGAFGRGNPEALVTLIVYNLMMDFGCKGKEQFMIMRNCDLIYGPLNSQSKPAFIKLSENVLKNVWKIRKLQKTENYTINDSIGRVDIDLRSPQTCPVENILFYQSKKTPDQLKPDMPFVLCPKKSGTYQDFWFQNQRLGKDNLMGLFRNALEKAGVDLSGQRITLSSAYRTRIRNNEQILKETQIKMLENMRTRTPMSKSSS